jgi:hypothetical protein
MISPFLSIPERPGTSIIGETTNYYKRGDRLRKIVTKSLYTMFFCFGVLSVAIMCGDESLSGLAIGFIGLAVAITGGKVTVVLDEALGRGEVQDDQIYFK